MPRMTAEVIAPPAPCRNRAPTSIAWLVASPHIRDATVKTTRPARNTRRRPSRSPSRPASRSRPPKAIREALTTQARLDWEKCKALWMDGSATFTTVMSRTIIIMPAHSTTSAIVLWPDFRPTALSWPDFRPTALLRPDFCPTALFRRDFHPTALSWPDFHPPALFRPDFRATATIQRERSVMASHLLLSRIVGSPEQTGQTPETHRAGSGDFSGAT